VTPAFYINHRILSPVLNKGRRKGREVVFEIRDFLQHARQASESRWTDCGFLRQPGCKSHCTSLGKTKKNHFPTIKPAPFTNVIDSRTDRYNRTLKRLSVDDSFAVSLVPSSSKRYEIYGSSKADRSETPVRVNVLHKRGQIVFVGAKTM
jgi:hypothetical protein